MAATLVACTAATLGAAAPAHADGDYCGHRVLGQIEAKYRSMAPPGREQWPWEGKLGCPISGEKTTPDGRAKFTTFQNGSIYWSQATGAHPIWGVIGDKWGQLGWERGALRLPTSDELTTPDGAGRRQVFEGGTVYWHPTRSRGAHPVWGEIGKAWGTLGWEGGRLGYPTSDELASPDGVGRYSQFEGGTVYWGNGFTCTVDASQIPAGSAARGFADEVGANRCGRSWRDATRILVSGRYAVRSRVNLVFCSGGDCPGVADASGDRVRINYDYARNNVTDWGMISHELSHIAQDYRGVSEGWATEGLADAVRYALGQPARGRGPAAACADGTHYTEGYECAAALLKFMDDRTSGNLIQDLNVYLHQQGSSASVANWVTSYTRDTIATQWWLCRTTSNAPCARGRA